MSDFLSENKRLKELEKAGELAMIISEVPPSSVLDTCESENVVNSFKREKYQNFFIAQRIAAKAHGVNPLYQVPDDIKNLVISRTAFLSAEYNLIYEYWDTLKVAAKQEGLITQTGQPRDFYKLLLETNYVQSFVDLEADTRISRLQRRSQKKKMEKDLAIHEKCDEFNANLSGMYTPTKEQNYQEATIKRGWMSEYKSLENPSQLLIDTADELSKTSSVIATAKDYYLNALKDKLRAELEHFG